MGASYLIPPGPIASEECHEENSQLSHVHMQQESRTLNLKFHFFLCREIPK